VNVLGTTTSNPRDTTTPAPRAVITVVIATERRVT